MTLTLGIPSSPPQGRPGWAERIAAAWNKTREGVIEVGRLLIAAKAEIDHGEWEAMIAADLPFSPQTARKLMAIAGDARIANRAHMRLLPNSWGTLYELTKLDDGAFDHAVTKGLIRPDMERKDAERLRQGERRAERLAASEAKARAGAPALDGLGPRWPVIYCDPPWDFETFSENGLQKAARLHYPTMSLEALAALPVDRIAGADAVIWMWAPSPHLWAALQLMSAWGFAYKSHCVWSKRDGAGALHRGHGYWFIGAHELLLVGTRGDMPAPLPGTQELSLIEATIGRHSEKPALFRDIIERYFPGVAKIEFFARAGAPGWDSWGHEAPKVDKPDEDAPKDSAGEDRDDR